MISDGNRRIDMYAAECSWFEGKLSYITLKVHSVKTRLRSGLRNRETYFDIANVTRRH